MDNSTNTENSGYKNVYKIMERYQYRGSKGILFTDWFTCYTRDFESLEQAQKASKELSAQTRETARATKLKAEFKVVEN